MANTENENGTHAEGSIYQRVIKPGTQTAGVILYEVAPVALFTAGGVFGIEAVAYSNSRDAVLGGCLSAAGVVWEVGKTAISIRRRRKKLLSRIQK